MILFNLVYAAVGSHKLFKKGMRSQGRICGVDRGSKYENVLLHPCRLASASPVNAYYTGEMQRRLH